MKKQKEVIEFDEDVLNYIKRVAKLSGKSKNTVINVLLAASYINDELKSNKEEDEIPPVIPT